jgi:hypothetical protein
MPTTLKLDDKSVKQTAKRDRTKPKQGAVKVALAEFILRRGRLRILELGGKIEFDPKWDYKKMRRRS